VKRTLLGAAMAVAMSISTPALAAVSVDAACPTDLTLSDGSSLAGCSGRLDGSLFDYASNADINAALTKLGYNGPAITHRALVGQGSLDSLAGSRAVNLPGGFSGTVYVGVQYDGGKDGPGKMAIYKIAASDLDLGALNKKVGGNAVVLAAVPARLPETATWAMLLIGFGAVGFVLRKAKAMADARFEAKLKRLAAGDNA
jgi:hypothetical protein